MSVYLRDIGNNALVQEALAVQTVTQTSTGNSCNMISGDGRVNCMVQISTFTGTSFTARAQASTASGGTYTDVTGATGSTTAAGVFFFTFDRPADNPFLKCAVTVNGTTYNVAATFIEQLKIY